MPVCCGIDGRRLPEHDAVVDAVLDVGRAIGDAENPLRVRFVLGEQAAARRRRSTRYRSPSLRIDRLDDALPRRSGDLLQHRPVGCALPRPLIAKPERRQDVQLGRLRAAIVNRDLNQDVFGRLLGVFDEHVEVAVLVEHARVEQLVLEFVAAAAAAGLDQVGIGKRRLRILVEVLHVRVRRRRVEVEVVFLDVLAVIALAVGQAEQPLLENRVLAVPQGQREAEPLLVVGDAGQAIFAPAIGARAGLVVAEIVPGIAAFAIVLADGAPLSFAQIGSPFFPRQRFASVLPPSRSCSAVMVHSRVAQNGS